ncbi:hypothetical protein ACJX0J_027039, partial [Zea mays]
YILLPFANILSTNKLIIEYIFMINCYICPRIVKYHLLSYAGFKEEWVEGPALQRLDAFEKVDLNTCEFCVEVSEVYCACAYSSSFWQCMPLSFQPESDMHHFPNMLNCLIFMTKTTCFGLLNSTVFYLNLASSSCIVLVLVPKRRKTKN